MTLPRVCRCAVPVVQVRAPWWTTPPTVLPLDEHIAYAQEYQAQLIGTKAGRKDGATRMELLTRVSAWLRAANRLRHSTPVELGDLRCDDEYILAANRIIGALFATLARAGVDTALTPECQAMRFAEGWSHTAEAQGRAWPRSVDYCPTHTHTKKRA